MVLNMCYDKYFGKLYLREQLHFCELDRSGHLCSPHTSSKSRSLYHTKFPRRGLEWDSHPCPATTDRDRSACCRSPPASGQLRSSDRERTKSVSPMTRPRTRRSPSAAFWAPAASPRGGSACSGGAATGNSPPRPLPIL